MLEAEIPRLARIRDAVTVHSRAGRRIDRSNLSGGATVKGALDGLADEKHVCSKRCRALPGGCPLKGQVIRSGIIADDHETYMDVLMPRAAPSARRGRWRGPWHQHRHQWGGGRVKRYRVRCAAGIDPLGAYDCQTATSLTRVAANT